mmetsp:Transcript_18019/g.54252  ORF Transcript_18019/g.54252 Transcript_18019/m.54252 type:complete len:263 (+) Transcript_18019:75-863(+)
MLLRGQRVLRYGGFFGTVLLRFPNNRTKLPCALLTEHRSCGVFAMSSASKGTCHPRAAAILEFWFGKQWNAPQWTPPGEEERKESVKRWYMGGKEADEAIVSEFGGDIEKLKQGEYDSWTNPAERLAAIILADQFTRNAFRGTADMFSLDPKAVQLANSLIDDRDTFDKMHPLQQQFVLMPLMHSEDLKEHERICSEMERLIASCPEDSPDCETYKDQLKFELAHRAVIEKFGRYPHRNQVLGRPNTAEEDAAFAAGTVPKW